MEAPTLVLMSVTVELPDEAVARLQAEAARRGISVDALVAELVEREFAPERTGRKVLGFIGMGSSTSGRTAREAEELLAEGFGRD